MAASFFFYDLETSGFDPRTARIMQFAGQRTDMELQPIGEPVNMLIKLTPDTLPEPDAVLVTGITPQQTSSEGLTEAEFLQQFESQVVQADTIFIGFNSVRFDDEFMRFVLYRNFYDPYEWQWANGCSRWDLLDVVRMTRALRPEGIEWPFTADGQPVNRLELLTKVNGLDHEHAHDALSDVLATIAVAKLIKTKQPDLFKYLLEQRTKKAAAEVVAQGQPFVYTSGRYPKENAHTTIAVLLAKHSQRDEALVYDLRHDPTSFLKMSVEELLQAWQYTKDPAALRLPVKTIKYNRCPALAPLGVIKDAASQQRINVDLKNINKHLNLLKADQTIFVAKLAQAVAKLDAQREAKPLPSVDSLLVDSRLYDGFISPADKTTMRAIRSAQPEQLSDFPNKLRDKRLKYMLPLYKARNYPIHLSDEERVAWDEFCRARLFDGGLQSRLARYFERLRALAQGQLTTDQQYLLEELQLYGQSIMPGDVTD